MADLQIEPNGQGFSVLLPRPRAWGWSVALLGLFAVGSVWVAFSAERSPPSPACPGQGAEDRWAMFIVGGVIAGILVGSALRMALRERLTLTTEALERQFSLGWFHWTQRRSRALISGLSRRAYAHTYSITYDYRGKRRRIRGLSEAGSLQLYEVFATRVPEFLRPAEVTADSSVKLEIEQTNEFFRLRLPHARKRWGIALLAAGITGMVLLRLHDGIVRRAPSSWEQWKAIAVPILGLSALVACGLLIAAWFAASSRDVIVTAQDVVLRSSLGMLSRTRRIPRAAIRCVRVDTSGGQPRLAFELSNRVELFGEDLSEPQLESICRTLTSVLPDFATGQRAEAHTQSNPPQKNGRLRIEEANGALRIELLPLRPSLSQPTGGFWATLLLFVLSESVFLLKVFVTGAAAQSKVTIMWSPLASGWMFFLYLILAWLPGARAMVLTEETLELRGSIGPHHWQRTFLLGTIHRIQLVRSFRPPRGVRVLLETGEGRQELFAGLEENDALLIRDTLVARAPQLAGDEGIVWENT